jgi:hypothetical protein
LATTFLRLLRAFYPGCRPLPRPSGSVDTGRDTFGIPFAFPSFGRPRLTEEQAVRFLHALEETCSELAFLNDVADRVLSKSIGTHHDEPAGNGQTLHGSSLPDGYISRGLGAFI